MKFSVFAWLKPYVGRWRVGGACLALCLAFATPLGHADSLRTETVAQGLEHPWALAFLPDGRFLVTERPGRLRMVDAQGRIGVPITGLPKVDARGQGGLLDLQLDSEFAGNRLIYLCYAEAGEGGNSTALARARLSPDGSQLTELQVLFRQQPKVQSSAHFGCRIVEGKRNGKADGTLYLALGERFTRKEDAQTLNNHHGKVIRILKDGKAPADNPFATPEARQAGALPEIWSYGHRNPQGLVQAPDGRLWEMEHGPQGGDEINLIAPGRNYGWPVITYGENYGGGKIGAGITTQAGMEQPLYYWTPSIAPSGMAFVSSQRYGKEWVGNLVVGSLKFGYLVRLELSAPFAGTVVRETQHLQSLGERVRDVRQGPDGWLYLLTDHPQGRLLRVLPR
ncbi:PQQ-dependent sugar dehydrogenase [Rhodoferax mekongensis]|uniref:PQQ-dependent sugar dehydrogenase n=1 Tax=Rhodoferax mekongensis TaxID=3068341 RepID=A0ABZ0AWT2_9BURK|nr:PQQ-dependent sugar dehydrogenase [Rhodoferax sp. TBRC 17307]WNO03603.1 PQQ-dependent sugar dehydrogenase [Rhodoferax sp. TBRC 17307]